MTRNDRLEGVRSLALLFYTMRYVTKVEGLKQLFLNTYFNDHVHLIFELNFC